jgi:rhodanese-related sulfurtransferase
MKSIPPADLNALLGSKPAPALIDVRTPVEYAGVYVEGSRNVPLSSLNVKALLAEGVVTRGEPVYLICRSGSRATTAAGLFAREGIESVFVVEGGTESWQGAGLPVQRGAVRVISLERQVRIAAGALVLAGLLLARLVSPWFIGLTAFVGAGLVFAGVTDFCGMALLLARFPWNIRATASHNSEPSHG